jgi:hypothetical protein
LFGLGRGAKGFGPRSACGFDPIGLGKIGVLG